MEAHAISGRKTTLKAPFYTPSRDRELRWPSSMDETTIRAAHAAQRSKRTRREGVVVEQSDQPLAFFITFTCKGTWLHGDRRGSVDREHAGRLPTLEETDELLANKDPRRYEGLVVCNQGLRRLCREQVERDPAQSPPYHQFTREVLTANGEEIKTRLRMRAQRRFEPGAIAASLRFGGANASGLAPANRAGGVRGHPVGAGQYQGISI